MTFEEFEANAPNQLRRDRLWQMKSYRLALYASRVVGLDAPVLAANTITREVASQVFRAVGSMRSHIAEGYGRSSGRDRVKYFEYALGSAREAPEWYSHSECVLGEELARQRFDVLDEIVRMLLAIIPRERGRTIKQRGRDET
jgi:four helix bundle protein